MSALVDLSGRRFGKLKVIKRAESKGKNSMWLCECECGNRKVVSAPNLKSGASQSCGCGVIEATIDRSTKHGGCGSKLYDVWCGMKARCFNKNNKQYDDYGGRGITVCKEWKEDFATFQKWALAHGYKEGLTIDRRNNDKGYSPDNCRWITTAEQNANRRPRRWAKKPVAV